MTASEMVNLFYQRQIRNAATGVTETPKQIAEGVRQDIATATRALSETYPGEAMVKALKDYPKGSGQVQTIAGQGV